MGRVASTSSTMARMAAASSAALQEHEVEPAVQLVVPVAVEVHERRQRVHVGLADQESGRLVAVGDGPPAPEDVMGLGAVGVVHRLDAHELLVERVVLGGRGIVPQLGILDHHVADVDAEAGDPPVPPVPHDVVEGVAHIVAPPVEVGLLPLEVVQEVLAAGLVELPGRTPEDADPVVRRPAAGRRIGPDVPVAVDGVAPVPGVDEPGVLIAGVVRDQVEQDADAAPPGLVDQGVEIVEGAEVGVDVAVVGDVVTPVTVGRDGDGREPDPGDAQFGQVVQPADDAREIAGAVPVRVGERTRVDLVEDAAVPPPIRLGGGRGSIRRIPGRSCRRRRRCWSR